MKIVRSSPIAGPRNAPAGYADAQPQQTHVDENSRSVTGLPVRSPHVSAVGAFGFIFRRRRHRSRRRCGDPDPGRGIGSVPIQRPEIGSQTFLGCARSEVCPRADSVSYNRGMRQVPRVNLLDPSVEPTDEELDALMGAVEESVRARRQAAEARFLRQLNSAVRDRDGASPPSNDHYARAL